MKTTLKIIIFTIIFSGCSSRQSYLSPEAASDEADVLSVNTDEFQTTSLAVDNVNVESSSVLPLIPGSHRISLKWKKVGICDTDKNRPTVLPCHAMMRTGVCEGPLRAQSGEQYSAQVRNINSPQASGPKFVLEILEDGEPYSVIDCSSIIPQVVLGM